MLLLLLSLMATAIYFVVKHYRVKMRPLVEKAEKIPGPQSLPLIGNALDFGTSTKRKKHYLMHFFLNNHFYYPMHGSGAVLQYSLIKQ
jgi:hypothetical protein